MRDKELKTENVKTSHTLGGAGEGGTKGEGSGEYAREVCEWKGCVSVWREIGVSSLLRLMHTRRSLHLLLPRETVSESARERRIPMFIDTLTYLIRGLITSSWLQNNVWGAKLVHTKP